MWISKKSLAGPVSTLLATIIAGLFFWIVLSSGLQQPLALDDSPQIVDNPDPDAPGDAPGPSWDYTTVKEYGYSVFSHVLHLSCFLALALLLSGPLFRLKLVLRTPYTGPPETFFA